MSKSDQLEATQTRKLSPEAVAEQEINRQTLLEDGAPWKEWRGPVRRSLLGLTEQGKNVSKKSAAGALSDVLGPCNPACRARCKWGRTCADLERRKRTTDKGKIKDAICVGRYREAHKWLIERGWVVVLALLPAGQCKGTVPITVARTPGMPEIRPEDCDAFQALGFRGFNKLVAQLANLKGAGGRYNLQGLLDLIRGEASQSIDEPPQEPPPRSRRDKYADDPLDDDPIDTGQEIILTLPASGGKKWDLTGAILDGFEQTYRPQGVDCLGAAREARAWLEAHPGRLRKKSPHAFLNDWFKRVADDLAAQTGHKPAPGHLKEDTRTLDEIDAEHEAKQAARRAAREKELGRPLLDSRDAINQAIGFKTTEQSWQGFKAACPEHGQEDMAKAHERFDRLVYVRDFDPNDLEALRRGNVERLQNAPNGPTWTDRLLKDEELSKPANRAIIDNAGDRRRAALQVYLGVGQWRNGDSESNAIEVRRCMVGGYEEREIIQVLNYLGLLAADRRLSKHKKTAQAANMDATSAPVRPAANPEHQTMDNDRNADQAAELNETTRTTDHDEGPETPEAIRAAILADFANNPIDGAAVAAEALAECDAMGITDQAERDEIVSWSMLGEAIGNARPTGPLWRSAATLTA